MMDVLFQERRIWAEKMRGSGRGECGILASDMTARLDFLVNARLSERPALTRGSLSQPRERAEGGGDGRGGTNGDFVEESHTLEECESGQRKSRQKDDSNLLSEEAGEMLRQEMNATLMQILLKAKDNALHRKSQTIERTDFAHAILNRKFTAAVYKRHAPSLMPTTESRKVPKKAAGLADEKKGDHAEAVIDAYANELSLLLQITS